MAKETVYNNTLVSGAADETLTYTRYVKDESSGKSTKELLDEKVNKTDQLGTTQIADKAITTEKLENESVTTDKLDAASVTTDKVANANITTSKLADSSVETEKINNKAVTTDKLNDGAVDNTKLSPNAVTSEKIKDESIITEKLNDRAVTTEKVEEKAITNTKIGDSAVDGRTISEASVEKKHLANDSVATEKLQDSSVTSDKIHSDAVTEEKIKDSSVSNAKLADNSVGTSKIKDGNITNEKVANNTLTQDKLDPELRKTIQAATGLPENLVEVIQDVDKEVKTLHSKDTDLQSQITDKQQQITAHDKDIELLQTRSTQMEQTINNIAATGGASVANTVAYTNTTSGLESVNAQGAIDELAAKNKSQDATISAKAEKSDVQSAVSELKEKDSALSAEIAKKFDKESISQESGDAEDKVMSQNAVSTKLSNLSSHMPVSGRYTYWSTTSSPKINIITNKRVLSWDNLVIVDIATMTVHSKYLNGLSMNLPLGGVLVIYGEIIKGETDLSLFYDVITNINSDEENTEFFKKITCPKDVVIIGVVKTNLDGTFFYDYLKIHSIPGDNPSLNNDFDALWNTIYDTQKVQFKYTYWSPTTTPVLQEEDNSLILSFPKLTIVRLCDLVAVTNQHKQEIVVNDKSSLVLVYYDLNDRKIYYVNDGNKKGHNDEDYKIITDYNSIVMLGVINNAKYIDLLKLSSIYINGNYDSSVFGEIERLKPNTEEPTIFTKYKWDIIGTIGPTNKNDIRIVDVLHVKHKYVYVNGKIELAGGSTIPDVYLYLDNRAASGVLENLWFHKIEKDEQGNFNGLFVIPNDIWEKVDFASGYGLFVFINNQEHNEYLTLRVYDAYLADYTGIDNPVILDNEKIEDTIKYCGKLNNYINIHQYDDVYGNDSKNNLASSFPIKEHVNASATTLKSESLYDGYLSEIRVDVNGDGEYLFKVGLLDQYPRFVVSHTFTLNLSNGLNVIDVFDKRIPISKGEQIAISCVSTAGESGGSSLKYDINSKHIEHELFYGGNNDTWKKLGSEYGGEITLSYKVVSIDSMFAFKDEVKILTEQVKKQNDTINSLRYIYDNNQVPYKLFVNNGEINIKSVQYKKVLALGNSLTSHGYAESVGYYGDATWAMASTNKVTTTWTNQLQNILRQKQPEATVTPFNIYNWETNYLGVDLNALFAPHKNVEYDLIIIRAGENSGNVTDVNDYAKGVDNLVTYLRTNYPLADIIITDMFWHNSIKEEAFKKIAEKYNYPYVSFGNIADTCLLGQMLMGKDDILHPIIHNGVAGHCTDVCFFNFANIIANAIGYTQIAGKYTVSIKSSIDYSINNTSQIKDGYVSILTYGTSAPLVSVKCRDEVIPSENHSLDGITWINTPDKIPTNVTTFKMPEGDVIVEL